MSNARNLSKLLGTDTQITTPDIADGVFQANKNLIINGAMQVAQRGTSGTSTADTYTVDRFAIGHGAPVNAMTFEQSTDAPNNFKNSIKITAGTGASASTTGYAILRQAIEGQNISHLGFGTSAAKAIILSFYVKSSLTGTFGVSIRNQAGNRGYGGTYIINSANTWEYVTIAIPADTGGTWPTDNGIGLHIMWDLGAGSNYDIAAGSWTTGTNIIGVESTVKLTETTGATWQMTGVQLEVGETATPFEHRRFDDEWHSCQRYCTVYNVGGGNTHGQNLVSPHHTVPGAAGHVDVTNRAEWFMSYPVKRSQPTITVTDPTNMRWGANGGVVVDPDGSVTFPVGTGHQNANVFQGVPSGISTSSVPELWLYKGSGTNPVITIDAEL